jgi:outer membrane protein TolC
MVSFGGVTLVAVLLSSSTSTSTSTTTTTTATPTPTPTPTSTSTSTSTVIPELSLDEALAELERQNLTLTQARSRADEARAASGQAQAQLLPSLSAGASYVRNSADAGLSIGPLPPLFPSGRHLVIQPLEQLSAQGTLRVPLVVPSAWYEVGAARSSARAADASAEAVRSQLRAGFAQAAHGARAAEEVVVASEQAVGFAAEHARSADRRVAAGVSPPLDALRARTELIRREGDLVRARAELGRARLALGILLGREGPVRIAVAAPPPPRAADAGGLAAGAVLRRPEVRAQHEQVSAAEQQVDATWARLAPQVSASGSVFASDVPYPTGNRDGWRASVDLTWPIFDGGLREARRRQARAQLATARAGAEAQRLAVIQEVADATRDLDVTRERLRLAETQRTLAADAAASARRSFEAGVASSLDVVDANDRLYQADVGLADARARLAQATIGLDRAAGR